MFECRGECSGAGVSVTVCMRISNLHHNIYIYICTLFRKNVVYNDELYVLRHLRRKLVLMNKRKHGEKIVARGGSTRYPAYDLRGNVSRRVTQGVL